MQSNLLHDLSLQPCPLKNPSSLHFAEQSLCEKRPYHVKISSNVSPRSIVLKFQEKKKREREKSLYLLYFFSHNPRVLSNRYDEEKGEKKENTGSLVSRWSGSHAVFFSRRKKQVNTHRPYKFERYPNLLVC